MKLLGMVLIALSAVSAAAVWQAEGRRRIRRLRDFQRLFSLMRGELAAYAPPLPELLTSLIPRLSGQAKHFAQSLLQRLSQLAAEGFYPIWERCVASSVPEAAEAEKRALEAVGQTLGRYDLARQCQVLEECERLLRKEAEQEVQALNQSRGLKWGLALSAAAMLVIVLS